ncbi:MAG: MotA/TolQ/ExbB proton channel family protein [Pseudomonadota bacterium]
MNFKLFSEPLVWVILLLAFFIFQRLLIAFFLKEEQAQQQYKAWLPSLNLCICALPLLGLLGTIKGLLKAFYGMSLGETIDPTSHLTIGIASALWTTQIGLITAVPAWLLYAWVERLLEKRKDIHGK